MDDIILPLEIICKIYEYCDTATKIKFMESAKFFRRYYPIDFLIYQNKMTETILINIKSFERLQHGKKINCYCGASITYSHQEQHRDSKKHINYLKKLSPTILNKYQWNTTEHRNKDGDYETVKDQLMGLVNRSGRYNTKTLKDLRF